MMVPKPKPLAELVRERHPQLRRSILDPGFTYRPAARTDVGETFRRASNVRVLQRRERDKP
jgi:hypothetical protein